MTVRELSGNRSAIDLTPARTSSFLSYHRISMSSTGPSFSEGTHLMSIDEVIHDPPGDTAKVHWSDD